MKRNGSILIFVLLTFMLISTGGLYAIYMASEQIEIADNSIAKLQSQYLAESKINRLLYDKEYFEDQIIPSIMRHNESNYQPRYTLNHSDIFLDDNNSISGEFYDHQDKRYLKLSTISKFQGTETRIEAYGPIFNEIFYDNNPALSYNTINQEHIDKFTYFMDGISDGINIDSLPGNIEGMVLHDYKSIVMENKNENSNTNYNIITKSFESEEENIYETIRYDDRVFMIVKSTSPDHKAKLHIKDDIYFRGILYVEGDLVITSCFRFLGVIIVNGDIIIDKELITKPRVEGALLYNGNLDIKDWDLRYQRVYINRFGIYLPNFIEPKLEVYKFL